MVLEENREVQNSDAESWTAHSSAGLSAQVHLLSIGRVPDCPLKHVFVFSTTQGLWLGPLERMVVRSSAPDT